MSVFRNSSEDMGPGQTLQIPQDVALEAAATALVLSMAKTWPKIVGVQGYTSAGNELKGIKGRLKKLEEMREDLVRPVLEAQRRINEFFREPKAQLLEAEAAIKSALGDYQLEQERIQGEAQRVANEAARKEREHMQAIAAKAEQAARERRIADEAKARVLEEAGKSEKAAAAREAADEREQERLTHAAALKLAADTMPAAVVVHQEAPKVVGVSSREDWKYEIQDERLIPREYLMVNEKAIGGVVRSLKAQTNIPGVRVYVFRTIASRST